LVFDIDIAMRNSYDIIINKISINNFTKEESSYFIHNPNHGITLESLRDMFNYFKSIREWNKVFYLSKFITQIKLKNGIQRLSKKNNK
tara:strand:+ start:2703 stop:2966 length:264 start_codon:yes stop_codon:yes gene_type:complete